MKNSARFLSRNAKIALTLGLLAFTLVNAVLVFTSRGAAWEDAAPLCFMLALIGLSAAATVATDRPRRGHVKGRLEPVPVPVVNARPARRRR